MLDRPSHMMPASDNVSRSVMARVAAKYAENNDGTTANNCRLAGIVLYLGLLDVGDWFAAFIVTVTTQIPLVLPTCDKSLIAIIAITKTCHDVQRVLLYVRAMAECRFP